MDKPLDLIAQIQRLQADAVRLVEAINRMAEEVEAVALASMPNTDETLAHIIARHARMGGVSVAAVMGPRRNGALVRVRQAVMAAALERGFSMSEIGRALGGRDHSTVAHGVKVHRSRMKLVKSNG